MTRALLRAAGSPQRARAGRASFASLAVTMAFAGVTWLVKEMPALDASQPRQDDPFDVLVSLDFAVQAFLVVMTRSP